MEERYSKKIIGDYYETIKITGTNPEPPELTEEEFKAGKSGIVWMDTKTGKLIFKPRKK